MLKLRIRFTRLDCGFRPDRNPKEVLVLAIFLPRKMPINPIHFFNKSKHFHIIFFENNLAITKCCGFRIICRV
jgi:hypothetical protein